MLTKRVHARHREFARFCFVGAVCAACNILLLWLLTGIAGFNYLVSCSISFGVINGLGFIANKYFVFARGNSNWASELVKYYVTMLGSLALNLGLMWCLVEVARLGYLAAAAVVTVSLAFFNFVAHSGWSFRSHRNGDDARSQ